MKSHQEEIAKMGNIFKITYDGPKIKVFHSLFSFYTIRNHQKTRSFQMFLGVIYKKRNCHEMS